MNDGKIGDFMIMEVLHDALPGRSQEQVVPFGLVYAGVRWGRDFRFGRVPKDEKGEPLFVCQSEETYRPYLSWLADYLYTLEAEPLYEQMGLCQYISRMQPQDSVLMMGMNVALYEWDTQDMEDCIENGESFSVFWESVQEYLRDLDDETEEYDEDTLRELFETVASELAVKKRLCPHVRHADVGYRLPLSIAIKKLQKPEQRVDLLDQFYQAYDNYASK